MLNYRFLYKIYHPIGWHHYGRNGSDSLSWYIHDMDFIVTFSKIHVYIWDLSSYWMAPLWSQWEWLSILVHTRYGFHRDIFQNTGLYMRFIILLYDTIMVTIGPTLHHGIYTTWIFIVSSTKYRFIYELIILLAGTIMAAMGLALYHGVYTTWTVLWIKNSGLQMRLISLIWTYTQHGFRCDFAKKKGFNIEI
jgi:hypothetical protein